MREHFRRRRACDAAGLGAAGQHLLVDVAVLGEHFAGALAEAVDDVEHAGRQSGLGEDLRELQRRQRRVFGGFDHGDAARREHGGE